MKHSVPHDLGQEKAKQVAESALNSYAKKFAEYSPTTEWTSEDQARIGFSVKGISLKGKVAVTRSTIDLDLDVPFILKPFQGKALAVIEGEIKKWIGKAKEGRI